MAIPALSRIGTPEARGGLPEGSPEASEIGSRGATLRTDALFVASNMVNYSALYITPPVLYTPIYVVNQE